MFDLSSTVSTYSTSDLVAVIIIGVIGGILGALYNHLVGKILRKYSIINEYVLNNLVLIIVTQ